MDQLDNCASSTATTGICPSVTGCLPFHNPNPEREYSIELCLDTTHAVQNATIYNYVLGADEFQKLLHAVTYLSM